MRLRAPAYPLITVDPLFSVWSMADKLTDNATAHWTGKPNSIIGTALIDGELFRFMGEDNGIPAMEQISVDCNALSTTYVFEKNGVRLKAIFTSTAIPDDLYLLSRPISYLEIQRENLDKRNHDVKIKISVAEQICTNLTKSEPVECQTLSLGKLNSARIGTVAQKIFPCVGDDCRISWGYFYLTGEGEASYTVGEGDELTFVHAQADLKKSTLFTFAYDDIYSLEYFHTPVKSYWNKDGALITDEIVKAHADYKATLKKCNAFADRLFIDAVKAGGEKYADILELAFRQVMGAHKLALDENGDVLFVSKECFSNGCTCTVDVSYPSIPLFLLYNPELIKGMLRPIYRYAHSKEWKEDYGYDFAPHDAGRYPKVNGQHYGAPGLDREAGPLLLAKQMPVEECGNMLVMEAAIAVATGSTEFANEHIETLKLWVKYLIENGNDPADQLCTDDFAGHLAHNCNLSLKAIMGIASLGIIYGMNGKKREERKYMKLAKDMALSWTERASNGDGSFRLAFDRPGTFSMKYNMLWDKLFGTNIFPREVLESEFASYRKHVNAFGLPLDCRQNYSKSDWLLYCATLTNDRDAFEDFIAPLWRFYNETPTRVPMTDWYLTVKGTPTNGCQNRTVQGGLFVKLLDCKGIMKYKSN